MFSITWHEWVGYLIGVVGVVVALYFGLAARKRRELVYSVNPVRTKVVTSGQATDLSVLYHDEPLGNVDITAVQLAIWNAGNESIEKADILGDIPITITTKPPARILEATVRNKPRDNIVGFTVQDSKDLWANGRVPISWKILEKNDTASIQLIYLGASDVDVAVEGAIKGRVPVKRVTLSSNFKSPQEHHKSRRKMVIAVSILTFLVVLIALLQAIIHIESELAGIAYVFLGFPLAMVLVSLLSNLRERFPPSGF